ncbi:MAG: polynucleotide adenylyltransferase PcnB [Treponemataceae bacterium]|nr:polynucleotide adenylyltransferase PcnB [Treponemataceae bacterium]
MLVRYGKDKNGQPVKKAVVYTKDEHRIPIEKIDSDAIRIIERLKENGHSAYLVGGAVRDLLVGNTPKDFDIVTDATPSRIRRIFRSARIIGRRFRLVHVVFGPKIFEVSTFRSIVEGSVGNDFGTMDEDVMRRDFTLNALYYDPIQEHVIDYVGGVRDIRKGVIRPVIPLDRIFVEDPVRMLRAVKYSATTHCAMQWQLRHRIKKNASLLSPISPSRLTEEIFKIINSGHAFDIVSEALDVDIYMYLQPAATDLILSDREFEKNYLANLKRLDALNTVEREARLGKKLLFLVKDFILSLTDWQKEIAENSAAGELYEKTWNEVRRFVLPMNPPRVELEYAIRSALREIGVNIRIPKPPRPESGEVNAAPKRRRRRRRKPAAPKSDASE